MEHEYGRQESEEQRQGEEAEGRQEERRRCFQTKATCRDESLGLALTVSWQPPNEETAYIDRSGSEEDVVLALRQELIDCGRD